MKLQYAQLSNGKFAICPDCSKVMPRRADGVWVCLLGCGKEILLKDQEDEQEILEPKRCEAV